MNGTKNEKDRVREREIRRKRGWDKQQERESGRKIEKVKMRMREIAIYRLENFSADDFSVIRSKQEKVLISLPRKKYRPILVRGLPLRFICATVAHLVE